MSASTPTREEFKRNASVGSDGQLESDDSSKKLRLDMSPKIDPGSDLASKIEDSGSGSPIPPSTSGNVHSNAREDCSEALVPRDTTINESQISSKSENLDKNDEMLESAVLHDVSVTSMDEVEPPNLS